MLKERNTWLPSRTLQYRANTHQRDTRQNNDQLRCLGIG